MGKEIRSVSFDCEGNLLAVGFKDGQISLVEFSMEKKTLTDVIKTRERNAPIVCIRYFNPRFIYRFSPNKKFLVASSENCCIDIFNFQAEKLTRVGYVTHIEDAVMQMDWATNSQYIRVKRFFRGN
jgi:WD40 repeat protein